MKRKFSFVLFFSFSLLSLSSFALDAQFHQVFEVAANRLTNFQNNEIHIEGDVGTITIQRIDASPEDLSLTISLAAVKAQVHPLDHVSLKWNSTLGNQILIPFAAGQKHLIKIGKMKNFADKRTYVLKVEGSLLNNTMSRQYMVKFNTIAKRSSPSDNLLPYQFYPQPGDVPNPLRYQNNYFFGPVVFNFVQGNGTSFQCCDTSPAGVSVSNAYSPYPQSNKATRKQVNKPPKVPRSFGQRPPQKDLVSTRPVNIVNEEHPPLGYDMDMLLSAPDLVFFRDKRFPPIITISSKGKRRSEWIAGDVLSEVGKSRKVTLEYPFDNLVFEIMLKRTFSKDPSLPHALFLRDKENAPNAANGKLTVSGSSIDFFLSVSPKFIGKNGQMYLLQIRVLQNVRTDSDAHRIHETRPVAEFPVMDEAGPEMSVVIYDVCLPITVKDHKFETDLETPKRKEILREQEMNWMVGRSFDL